MCNRAVHVSSSSVTQHCWLRRWQAPLQSGPAIMATQVKLLVAQMACMTASKQQCHTKQIRREAAHRTGAARPNLGRKGARACFKPCATSEELLAAACAPCQWKGWACPLKCCKMFDKWTSWQQPEQLAFQYLGAQQYSRAAVRTCPEPKTV